MIELKRQFVHMCGIFLILVLQIFGKWNTIALLFSIAVIFIISGRFRRHKKPEAVEKVEKHIISNFERKNEFPFKGAITFAVGSLLAILFFPETIAFACIAVLAISDGVSTIFGKSFGKHRILKATVEGSSAFFISAFIILYFFTSPIKAVIFAFIVTIIEMLPIVDDNLTIPLSVGILLTL